MATAGGSDGDRDADFASFVAASSYRLLRTAYALTGDRALAERALERALARTYRRWRWVGRAGGPEAPEDYAHRALVSATAGRRVTTPRPEPASLVPDRALAERVVASVAAGRRRLATGVVVAALVATGGGLAATLPHQVGSADKASALPRPSAPSQPPLRAVGGAITAVAASEGLLYLATSDGGHAEVAAYDRGTGALAATAFLPGPADRLAAAHGTLWVSFDPTVAELRSLVWHMSGDLDTYGGLFVAGAPRAGDPLALAPLDGDQALLATEVGVVRVGLPTSGQLGGAEPSLVRLPRGWRPAQAVPLRGDVDGGAVAVLPADAAGRPTGQVAAVVAGRVVATYRPAGGAVAWLGPADPDGVWAVVRGPGASSRLVRLDVTLRPVGGLRLAAGGQPRTWVAGAAAWVAAAGQLRCLGPAGGAGGSVRLGSPALDVAVAGDEAYVATAGGLVTRPVPDACRA